MGIPALPFPTPSSSQEPILRKVTAFVTRDVPSGRQLLLFKHPTGSIQLPAGTVEIGEVPSDAVMREVYEETGLTDVELVDDLGIEDCEMRTDERVVLHTIPTRTQPNPASPLVDLHLRRGIYVRELSRLGAYAEIVYEDWAIVGGEHRVTQQIKGWVPADSLTGRVERHFYHVRATKSPDRPWNCFAEGRYQFHLYWHEINEKTNLLSFQEMWWNRWGRPTLVPNSTV